MEKYVVVYHHPESAPLYVFPPVRGGEKEMGTASRPKPYAMYASFEAATRNLNKFAAMSFGGYAPFLSIKSISI